ncbi:hypothetical protein KC367_g4051 [Hortaea werneckii]|uniref:EKC/KEOPS complex subunit BUD32 n=2 Tax=Hortaea werneckii TaxID=91943 RepID=A0A3M7IBS8_HORWE|nr:hypothetical protein KC358_g18158 [Hortaea werneckii]OTA37800.1 hypothetical protein BTJ68_01904 [Hortaea werneckii EXF-2000]KAI6824279.1 hypothetical protein KC350_g9030 [Hortaea werneckii]KAI6921994.1 hypothetical protein KC348_g9938 [Hortaea werneckii]KAI6925721.1 hypothetical protein KC341_g13207 [Hortaea werneckii]
MPDSTTTTTDPSSLSPHHHILPPPFNNPTPADQQTPLDLIAQGAESLLFRTTFLSPSQPAALKIRPRKTWRHPTLDKRLTRARILAEARVLVKLSGEGIASAAGKGGAGGGKGKGGKGGKVKDPKPEDGKLRHAVPRVLGLDWEAGWLVTEWIRGPMVKSAIFDFTGRGRRAGDGVGEEKKEGIEKGVKELLARIGTVVGRLHAAGVVHGDLTTSNLMLRRDGASSGEEGEGVAVAGTEENGEQGRGSGGGDLEGEVVLIDFGLALQSTADEDRAVDLYVLERAFGSTHPREEHLFPEVITAYQRTMNELGGSVKGAKLGAGDVVVRRLEDVRMRGRKKSMIG